MGGDPPGDPASYSDSAIQTCLMLRAAFKLALRQAEGLMLSVVELLGCELAVPDHTTVSRRAAPLESITRGPLHRGLLHVLIDSTGLKVYGAGQWQTEKHGRSRRKWRKLHLGVDARSGQIVAVTLTDQDVSDESQVGALLEQIESPIEQVTADGAYASGWARHLDLTGQATDHRVHDGRGGDDREGSDDASGSLAVRRRFGRVHRPAHGRVVHTARMRGLVDLSRLGAAMDGRPHPQRHQCAKVEALLQPLESRGASVPLHSGPEDSGARRNLPLSS